MRVGSASPCLFALGNTTVVPIYIRDVAGTPLGVDQPPGKKIQGISFQITYSPADAVSSVRIKRTGVLETKVATSEFALSNSNSVSYLGVFDEQFNTIAFHLNAPPPGDLIAELTVTLSPSAAGKQIDFTFGSSTTTALTDQAGLTSETRDNGTLVLFGGCVQVGGARRRAVRGR